MSTPEQLQQTASPAGLDLDALKGWMDQQHPGLAQGPLGASLITGGKSNLTYLLSDGRSEWIIRRPPLGSVMATAHDMRREYDMAHALRDTAVPVPAMLAYGEDESVLGAKFYIMEKVDGVPYRFRSELEALGEERARTISTCLIHTLADLHQVDFNAVGLGGFGRPQGYLERQVKRWKTQMEKSKTRELPGADELHDLLAANVPQHGPQGIVHGDFRLDNVLMAPDDTAAAVIDWEMATLGDPLLDLALMLVYQRRAKIIADWDSTNPAEIDVTQAAGYLSEEQIIELYAQRSGFDLDGFGFYLGLACFKLAGIGEGVRFRALNGQMVGEGFEQAGNSVPLLLELGLEAVKEYK